MATKKKVNAREARREAALAQIVDGMAGAFGDYVRAQMAQRPQAAPQAQPLMGMRGPLPQAPVGDGTGGAPVPPQPWLQAGNGQPIMPTWSDIPAPPSSFPFAPQQLPDPGFINPGPQVVFEDGSMGAAMPNPDPGFMPQRIPTWLEALLSTMPARRF